MSWLWKYKIIQRYNHVILLLILLLAKRRNKSAVCIIWSNIKILSADILLVISWSFQFNSVPWHLLKKKKKKNDWKYVNLLLFKHQDRPLTSALVIQWARRKCCRVILCLDAAFSSSGCNLIRCWRSDGAPVDRKEQVVCIRCKSSLVANKDFWVWTRCKQCFVFCHPWEEVGG